MLLQLLEQRWRRGLGMARQLRTPLLKGRGRHWAGERRGLSSLLLWCCTSSGMLPWITLLFLPQSYESSCHPCLAGEELSPPPARKGGQGGHRANGRDCDGNNGGQQRHQVQGLGTNEQGTWIDKRKEMEEISEGRRKAMQKRYEIPRAQRFPPSLW